MSYARDNTSTKMKATGEIDIDLHNKLKSKLKKDYIHLAGRRGMAKELYSMVLERGIIEILDNEKEYKRNLEFLRKQTE